MKKITLGAVLIGATLSFSGLTLPPLAQYSSTLNGTIGVFSSGLAVGIAAPSTLVQINGALTMGGSAGTSTAAGDIVGVGKLAIGGSDANGTSRIFNNSNILKIEGASVGTQILNVSTSPLVTFLNGGNVGVGTANPTERLHVIGTINVTQAILVGGAVSINGTVQLNGLGSAGAGTALVISAGGQMIPLTSSKRFKENIQALDKGDAVMKLQTIEFDYKDGGGHDYGFAAEDVYEVLPDIVNLGSDGKPYSLKNEAFIPLLLNEIKKLNARIEALETK